MSKKQEQEAKTSLEKLDELTKDILTNSTDGGDPNFRHLVFTGLTQTKNPILLDKMKELLLDDNEHDLKKTIVLGIFIHKEMFLPVIEYGEKVITMPFIDESYDEKESFLFILDALIELAYKDKLNDFESALPLFNQLFKISCSEKSSSILADKLLQRILNSKIGTVKTIQKELNEIILDANNEINLRVIAINILSKGLHTKVLDAIETVIKDEINSENLINKLPIIDVSTLALNYFQDKKCIAKIRRIIALVQKLNLNEISDNKELIERINRRIEKFTEDMK